MTITKLDLHLHTKGSDGSGKPEDFVKAIRRAEIDGIVITDHHNTITKEGLEVAALVRASGLKAFIACEYSTKDGHLLVFGVNVAELGLGMYPEMQLVIDRVWAAGGVALPSHPYRGLKTVLGDDIFKLHNLTHAECYNGQNETGTGSTYSSKPEANQKAIWAAEKMGLAQTGGSDAHQPERIGTCYTEFGSDIQSTVDLVRALRARDHVARVHEALAAEQKASAKSYSFNYSSSTSSKHWSDDVKDEEEFESFFQGLDDEQVQQYLLRDEEDASEGLDDDRIPRHAFGDDFAEVQEFLNSEHQHDRSSSQPVRSDRGTRRRGGKSKRRGRR